MIAKEKGYILSFDQASLKCGVSLWCDGIYVDGVDLIGGEKSTPYSIRLQNLQEPLDEFLTLHNVDRVKYVVFEHARSSLVMIGLGALLVNPRIQAKIGKDNFIHSSSWKAFARRQGAEGDLKSIKGVKALKEIGWSLPVESDDVADSILIYLTWRSR